jgi:hypothetical protein
LIWFFPFEIKKNLIWRIRFFFYLMHCLLKSALYFYDSILECAYGSDYLYYGANLLI